jgi:hypothetical protein
LFSERPTGYTTSGKKVSHNFRVPELNSCTLGNAGPETRPATDASSEMTHNQPLDADIAAEWNEMSRILDIFFFVIFLLATVVISIVLLIWYPRLAPTYVAPVAT